MLVLSRKVGQSILVGDHISIQVLQVTGGAVRLGIEAPADIRILRGELEQSVNDEPFSSMARREQEANQFSSSTTEAKESPSPGTRISSAPAIDPQQLLRQTDLL